MQKTQYRRCPSCKKQGVDIKEVYPDGTACKYCAGHIEVNFTALMLIMVLLMAVMLIDLHFYDTGIGLFAALILILIGALYQRAYGALMPLKCQDPAS